MSFAATAETGVTHERRGAPATCTVHAPHCQSPQPNLGALSDELITEDVEQRRVRLGGNVMVGAVYADVQRRTSA